MRITRIVCERLALWEGWTRGPSGKWLTGYKGGWAHHAPDYLHNPRATMRLVRKLTATGYTVEFKGAAEGAFCASIYRSGVGFTCTDQNFYKALLSAAFELMDRGGLLATEEPEG